MGTRHTHGVQNACRQHTHTHTHTQTQTQIYIYISKKTQLNTKTGWYNLESECPLKAWTL